ncbi:uncharacterized protein F4812DRAFT_130015 [Daldinia caldariorum]|uniref:uncharacterized protein n=1 Tax=Daldinia caldariorum TaxID=326644 RepID=UPI0020073F8B|nr:uncharacterized protein F4812DRAFT_130015 [Daldinia caldariorum]KAI1465060.1 hypothetical protein F4812DRAFT_130015 [Daldinia caldariorum]
MKYATIGALASVAATAVADKTDMTFAVLHFTGQQKFLTEGPIDPVVNPGTQATHYHSIMGGSNFGPNTRGDDLLNSKCTTTTIKNDKSNYWVPSLFFQDPKDGTFEKVPLFYMNVYYFFEPTNGTIEPFPVGLKMMSGDTNTRDPPKFGGGSNVDPTRGPIQPVQWTCPRQSYNPPSYPVDSDGTTAGLQDPNNQGAGAGFPLYDCDGTYSPLRQDIHFPSCYNPEVGLDDYKNNVAWPTPVNGLLTCPAGWIHIPHLFYEVYWDTPSFKDRWTPDGKTQPFVLSNGDATGYSSHGDFISGWDQDTLKTIIDTCNVGTLGMEHCPNIPGGVNTDQDCTIEPAIGTMVKASQKLKSLPLNLPVTGWGKGGSSSGSGSESGSSSSEYSASSTSDSTSAGNVFVEQPSSSAEAAAPAVTAAAVAPAEQGNPNVATVWDTVYVTETTTAVVEPTPAARRRRASHGHDHMKRHQHGAHGRQ